VPIEGVSSSSSWLGYLAPRSPHAAIGTTNMEIFNAPRPAPTGGFMAYLTTG
jgi:hypothetical protein